MSKIAEKEIDKKKKEIMKLVKECKKIADKANITFELQVAYFMGGTYYPPKIIEKNDWMKNNWKLQEGWLSSTNSCS